MTRILKHGADQCIGGCIPNDIEETHIQYTISYNLFIEYEIA